MLQFRTLHFAPTQDHAHITLINQDTSLFYTPPRPFTGKRTSTAKQQNSKTGLHTVPLITDRHHAPPSSSSSPPPYIITMHRAVNRGDRGVFLPQVHLSGQPASRHRMHGGGVASANQETMGGRGAPREKPPLSRGTARSSHVQQCLPLAAWLGGSGCRAHS